MLYLLYTGIYISMILSHSHKFIFLKPAKTAGTSVENLFEKYCDTTIDVIPAANITDRSQYTTHMKSLDFQAKLNDDNIWHNYLKFVTVRNPWDRLVSFFCFKKQYLIGRFDQSLEFNQWIKTLNENNRFFKNNMCPISSFLNNDLQSIDYFIMFENLEQGVEDVRKLLKLPKIHTLKHRLKTKRHLDYRKYYDLDSIDIVAYLFKEDIENFGYAY